MRSPVHRGQIERVGQRNATADSLQNRGTVVNAPLHYYDAGGTDRSNGVEE
jgi:hypothetical protein